MDVLLPLPHLRLQAGVAGGRQKLPGLFGGALHQPQRWGPDVLHRHRGGKAAASAPLLLLRGLLRPGQRRVLRRSRGGGAPPAGPPGLRPLLGPEPRHGRPHRPGAKDHSGNPHRPFLRRADDHPQRHRHPAPGGPGAPGPLRRAGRPVRGGDFPLPREAGA